MTTDAAPALITAERITVRLGTRTVLSGASTSLASGELVAIVGANGAGKSTLLRALAGLVPVSDGDVRVGSRPIASLGSVQLGREVAYLPQERAVHWPLSCHAVVALGRLPHLAPGSGLRAADLHIVSAALAAMDAGALADRPVTELSGGERARVLVARALAQDTPVLLADEPTAGLDPAHALALFEVFERLRSEGRGIAVALHDLSLAARFATRVVLLKHGRVIADGPVDATLSAERMAEAFGVRARLAEIDGLRFVLPFDTLS